MNFQKLFGPLTRSREDRFFDEIIGHENIKRVFGLALRSDEPTHMSILQTINQMGYDPRKVLTELARIKSLRETEKRLKRECKMLEMQSAQYKGVLPTCQQIARLGIGFPELIMFHSAIIES